MIEVNIDLNHYGLGKKTNLYYLKIWNNLTGTNTRRNYNWEINNRSGRKWKSGEVVGWPSTQKSAFRLIQEVMNQI